MAGDSRLDEDAIKDVNTCKLRGLETTSKRIEKVIEAYVVRMGRRRMIICHIILSVSEQTAVANREGQSNRKWMLTTRR